MLYAVVTTNLNNSQVHLAFKLLIFLILFMFLKLIWFVDDKINISKEGTADVSQSDNKANGKMWVIPSASFFRLTSDVQFLSYF